MSDKVVYSSDPALAGMAVGTGESHDFVMARIQMLIGHERALTIDEVILNISRSMSSKAASAIGAVLLLLGASGVVAELRNSLNQIWKARPKENGLAPRLSGLLRGWRLFVVRNSPRAFAYYSRFVRP